MRPREFRHARRPRGKLSQQGAPGSVGERVKDDVEAIVLGKLDHAFPSTRWLTACRKVSKRRPSTIWLTAIRAERAHVKGEGREHPSRDYDRCEPRGGLRRAYELSGFHQNDRWPGGRDLEGGRRR